MEDQFFCTRLCVSLSLWCSGSVRTSISMSQYLFSEMARGRAAPAAASGSVECLVLPPSHFPRVSSPFFFHFSVYFQACFFSCLFFSSFFSCFIFPFVFVLFSFSCRVVSCRFVSRSRPADRQVCALQLIGLCQRIFAEANLELFLQPYVIVSTGSSSGLVQCLTDAIRWASWFWCCWQVGG